MPSSPPPDTISPHELLYSPRVKEIVSQTHRVEITEASRSTESHSKLQPFIVYSILFGPLVVKRRYSEFESLRVCLIKCFPTQIVPPIPEKQSLTSNLSETAKDMPSSSLVEYRKRMLGVFLNRCMEHAAFRGCKFFVNFLDPETNFHDYLELAENAAVYRTSLYRLAPFDPLHNLSNQLYLTLPVPTTAADQFPELGQKGSGYQRLLEFDDKFRRYELVLDKMCKSSKRLLKHFRELGGEFAELGSQYNTLSLLQDSDVIEELGKTYERKLIFLGSTAASINNALDRLIELKHFTSAVKDLTEYNCKKIVQWKMVEQQLEVVRAKYRACEAKQAEINKIEVRESRALGPGKSVVFNPLDAPITDQELQTALYAESKKSFYGKIPGVSKLNKVFLRYTDSNPEQTRRNDVYNLKLRLYQTQRQDEILMGEIGRINREVMKQLVEFHGWFRKQLVEVVTWYQHSFTEYIAENRAALAESTIGARAAAHGL